MGLASRSFFKGSKPMLSNTDKLLSVTREPKVVLDNVLDELDDELDELIYKSTNISIELNE